MKVYGVRIFVDDIAAATKFYGETMGLRTTWSMPELKAAGFSLENVDLIVEEVDPTAADAKHVGRYVGISIQVDDIEATYRDLTAKGVPFDMPPEMQVWGGRLAHFRDPAGNVLTLLG